MTNTNCVFDTCPFNTTGCRIHTDIPFLDEIISQDELADILQHSDDNDLRTYSISDIDEYLNPEELEEIISTPYVCPWPTLKEESVDRQFVAELLNHFGQNDRQGNTMGFVNRLMAIIHTIIKTKRI